MNKSKVSIITACYNSERYIEECVKSVSKLISLDEFEWEHVVVDDGSTDNTKEVLNRLNYPNLKILYLDNNLGVSSTRNYAIERIDSDYLFVLDADDVIFQNSIRYLFEAIKRNDNKWAYGDFLRCNGNLSYSIGDDYFGWYHKDYKEVLYAIYTGAHFFQQNSLYLRSLFQEVGGFTAGMAYAEDTDLLTRFLLKEITPLYVETPLYLHRNHGDNISAPLQQNPLLQKNALKDLYMKYKNKIDQLLNIEEIDQIDNYFNRD